MRKIEKFEMIINNNYCSGCGNCAFVSDGVYKMKLNNDGHFLPSKTRESLENIDYDTILKVCPFSNESRNESSISQELYSLIPNVKFSEDIGFYLKNFAGFVNEVDYRSSGGSGGIGTWLASKMLQQNYVDYVVHVKSENSQNNSLLFSYQVSSSIEEIKNGAKSKYYPVEMSYVIEQILNTPGRYLIVGIPCFIKAIRLLSLNNDVLKERVKYTMGLVCGHMKSDMFSKSMAWEVGVHPSQFEGIDFRVKIEGAKASKYGVKIVGNNQEKVMPTANLFTTNWGHGLFKLKACDYCDDVLAETADITIGDAWLPKYIKDSEGTNIIVIRNEEILNIFKDNISELSLEDINPREVYLSQEGGFRHKREGLAYRLKQLDNMGYYRPQKRIEASDKIRSNRKNIYGMRMELSKQSFKAYKLAEENDNFNTFKDIMQPYIKKYNRMLNANIIERIIKKIQSKFNKRYIGKEG